MTENPIPANVLLVDDNPAKLTAMAAALADMDVEVVTAASGMEALRKLLVQDFAVVLLDVNMPIIDGFETARTIRLRPRSEHLPIIFVTAERMADDERLKGYELGAVDYIFSPVLPQILRAKVAVFAKLYRMREQLLQHEDTVRQNQILEQASRMKNEFLANMSHELRTPLNSIIGFAELLKDGVVGELNQQQQEFSNLIYNSGHHLLALINEILDLTKVEAGKMTFEPAVLNLPSLLHSALAMLREKALKHDLRVSLEIEAGLETIQADERKLKQVLYNLLSNAIKFTNAGGHVSVGARRAPGRDSTGRMVEGVEIAVADSGIGIATEDVAKLFQPFVQLDASLARHHEGSGLGLAMVKRLVELHDGRVTVASEVGKGSCFYFWLPSDYSLKTTAPPGGAASMSRLGADGNLGVDAAHTNAVPAKAAFTNARGRLVLIVEDDDAAATLLGVQMDEHGLSHARAATVDAALEWLRNHKPDFITLDILLPDASGWDLLNRLKAEPHLADIPVVILSVIDEAKKGFLFGAAAVLQKPVAREQLERTLNSLGLTRIEPQEKPRVLVVDDDPQQTDLFKTQLGSLNCEFLVANGGQAGIELAKRECPDLLILDLMMPEVTGFDVIEALRADPVARQIPIMVLTAKDLTAKERKLLNASVSKIMQKSGLSRKQFLAEVRALLRATLAKL